MKRLRCLACYAVAFFALSFLTTAADTNAQRKTKCIIFVMTDGLRWQEVFGGADDAIMLNKSKGGVKNVAELKKAFWRNTPEERREALLPFTWSVMVKQGQIYGNKDKGSDAHVTNWQRFSYPCYSETLCGFPDPSIDSNSYPPNPNVTVLEWLNQKQAFRGRVAAFGAWNAFARIFNRDRCGFIVNCGFEPMPNNDGNLKIELLNKLKKELPHTWDTETLDAVEFYSALEFFKANKPRIFFVSLGETDGWGHERRYDEYLTAAHRADEYVKTLWETAQAMPEYQGKTSLIFSTDHGRGNTPKWWMDHGNKVEGSENIWIAFLGPDTPALGERTNIPDVTQNQIASTLAAFIGEDYCAAVPKAGKPIADALATPDVDK
jgi:hypothetical protein